MIGHGDCAGNIVERTVTFFHIAYLPCFRCHQQGREGSKTTFSGSKPGMLANIGCSVYNNSNRHFTAIMQVNLC